MQLFRKFYEDTILIVANNIASVEKKYIINLGFTPKSIWFYPSNKEIQFEIIENGFSLYVKTNETLKINWIVEKE